MPLFYGELLWCFGITSNQISNTLKKASQVYREICPSFFFCVCVSVELQNTAKMGTNWLLKMQFDHVCASLNYKFQRFSSNVDRISVVCSTTWMSPAQENLKVTSGSILLVNDFFSLRNNLGMIEEQRFGLSCRMSIIREQALGKKSNWQTKHIRYRIY